MVYKSVDVTKMCILPLPGCELLLLLIGMILLLLVIPVRTVVVGHLSILLLEVLLLLLVGGAPGWRVSVTRGNGRVARRGVGHRGTHQRSRRRLLL